MTTQAVLSGEDIRREVPRFEPFGKAFRAFHSEFDRGRLFVREAPDDPCGAVAGHLADGRYLLHAFKYQFSPEACEKAVFALIEIFTAHLPIDKAEMERIRDLFASRRLDARDFLMMVFRNRGDRFLEVIGEHGLNEDLATLWAVYLARLFRIRAARHLCEEVTFFDWADWGKGYCPICGHWPALAHIQGEGSSRTLWCLNCGTTWPFEPYTCIYCLNANRKRLELLGPQDDPSSRAQACQDCGKYLKEVLSDGETERFSFDAWFLGTHMLDVFARGRGFVHGSPLVIESDSTSSEAQLLTRHLRLPWEH